MKFAFTSQPVDRVAAELVLLMYYQDEVPLKGLLGMVDWRVNGKLSRLIQRGVFSGNAREMLLMPAERRFKADKLVLLGLGRRADFEEGHIPQVFDFIFQTASRMRASQICLSISRLLPSQFEWRSAVRLFVSKLVDFPSISDVVFCEPHDVVQETKRRQLDFGSSVELRFDEAS